jgi:CRP-like cAMP-binding protein
MFKFYNPHRSLHPARPLRLERPSLVFSPTVQWIYKADDFFGESSLIGPEYGSQRAIALDTVALMSWDAAEIEDQVQRQPRLGIALMQMLAKRTLDYGEPIQSFALHQTPERLVSSLLRFRLGEQNDDGSARIPPLTHQVISEHVGTSREIVTFHMNRLRQMGRSLPPGKTSGYAVSHDLCAFWSVKLGESVYRATFCRRQARFP